VRERGTIWIHAASVGEAEAARPIVAELERLGTPLLVTTFTSTGRDQLRRHFPGLAVRLVPLDLPGLVSLSLRRVRPRCLVLVETEIWPNLIRATRAVGGRVVIISGRISDRSFPRYRRFRRFVADVVQQVDRIGVRSEEDGRRFVALGAAPESVSVTGDLKLDRPSAPPPDEDLRRALGPGPFLIGGSTHAGEEEALLEAWAALRAGPAPGLRLLLVPRHPERVSEVCGRVRRRGIEAGLRSRSAPDSDVVIVDTLGELASMYWLADLVFAGGTLASVGGHNLFEPVQAGKVVVHGPHVRNQRHQVQILEPLGVLHRVEDIQGLRSMLERLWKDPNRNAPAEAARARLLGHCGASQRALSLILGSEAHGA
jgi:3-deoxy-D-manno-octulosonic-acid transferase